MDATWRGPGAVAGDVAMQRGGRVLRGGRVPVVGVHSSVVVASHLEAGQNHVLDLTYQLGELRLSSCDSLYCL